MVDSKYIGHFYEGEGKVHYLPSIEYFEAGKFKNRQIPDFDKNLEIIKVRTIFTLFISYIVLQRQKSI